MVIEVLEQNRSCWIDKQYLKKVQDVLIQRFFSTGTTKPFSFVVPVKKDWGRVWAGRGLDDALLAHVLQQLGDFLSAC